MRSDISRLRIELQDRSFVTLRRDLDSTIGLLNAIRNAQVEQATQVARVRERQEDVAQIVFDIDDRIAALDGRAAGIELTLNELIRTLSQSP